MRRPARPFPPVGIVAAPCGSPAVPHLQRYYFRVRLLACPWPPPPVSLGGGFSSSRACSLPSGNPPPRGPGCFGLGANRAYFRERQGALLGSREIPLKACPGLGTPATPGQPRVAAVRMLPCARLTASASQRRNDFGAESSRPASLLCTLRTRQSPGEWQHSLPACPLRL